MCVSSFKKGFTSLSLKTRLLDEKQHRSTHWLLLLLMLMLAMTTALLYHSASGGRRAPPPSRLETSTPAM